MAIQNIEIGDIMQDNETYLRKLVETMFEDIDGKNKELISLKTHIKMTLDELQNKYKEIEQLKIEIKELNIKNANMNEEYDEIKKKLLE